MVNTLLEHDNNSSQGRWSATRSRAPLTTNPVLTRAMGAIRAQRAALPASMAYEVRRGRVFTCGRPSAYAQVWFQTSGCRHDRRGECTMCNYGWASAVSSDAMIDAVRRALIEVGDADVLYISPSGSLFDSSEVPADALHRILEMARMAPATEFLCETRPHTVTDATAFLLRSALGHKQITVEMGLESANTWVLRYSINKSISLDDYDRAMQLLRAYNIRTFSNVLLGSPMLDEPQSIRDATQSALWALAHGTHSIVIFPSHVRRWTLLSWLWDAHLYHPPSLWSLVETLWQIGPEHSARVGISWYWRPRDDRAILASPTTCERCSARVQALLDNYRAWRNFDYIHALYQLECQCKDVWRAQCAAASDSVAIERITSTYERLGQTFADAWWKRNGEAFLATCVSEYAASMRDPRAS